MNTPATQLVVALDVDTLTAAETLVDQIGAQVDWYKVGKQLFTGNGPAAVRLLKQRGKRVFLDLKFHDIPNTVAQAIRVAANLGVDMVNVHAGGGPAMLRAAAEAATDRGVLLVAVTVLTSINDAELLATGVEGGTASQVLRLARLAQACGVAGVVCSALEIDLLRQVCGQSFKLVVPGIRPAGAEAGDQKRIMTPAAAAAAGADFIVVGRPISAAEQPAAAAAAVMAELSRAR